MDPYVRYRLGDLGQISGHASMRTQINGGEVEAGSTNRRSSRRHESVEASQFGALAEQLNGDEDGNNTIRRTRGPTFMTDIWGVRDDERLEVGWNEFGQPDDKLGTKLSCFIGTIIRDGKKAPIHHKDWHNVPQKCKDDIWDLVQTMFNVPSPYRKWVMHCASKKLRSWKATLKRKFYSENLSIEEQMHYKDKRVYTEQWLKLIEHWKTEKGQSATNKKSRYQKKYNHTTGTKSFSRIRKEENVKLGHCPSRARMFKVCYTKKNGTSEATKNMIEQIDDKMAADESLIHEGASPNDLFAQVMGKEKNGHVRTYGLGVAPTDLWKDAYGRRAEKKAMAESMQNELIHLRSQVQELRSLFIQGSNTTTLRQIPGVYNSTLAEHQSTPYFTETQNTQPVQVGEEVVLKSISRPSQTVAIGILHSKDASKQVDGMELGPDFWEIHIQVPVEHNERLVRAYANMRTIGQAAGALVAWPIPFVISQAVDASRNYGSMDSSAS